jgi:hypothetical protein
MSNKLLSFRDATAVVSDRFKVSADKAQILLLDAHASGKVHIITDEAKFTERSTEIQEAMASRAINKTLGSQQADVAASGFANSGSALDVIRESATRGAIALSVIIECGMVSQGELMTWLDSISQPDPVHLKQAKRADILEAARAVCFDPKNNNPNTTDAEPLVKQCLAAQGLRATRNQIRPILNLKEFANRRNKQGVRKRG